MAHNHSQYTEKTASHDATSIPDSAFEEVWPTNLRRQSWGYIAERDDALPQICAKDDAELLGKTAYIDTGLKRQPLEFLEALSREQRIK